MCRRVVKGKVLRIDGPFRAQGFLSLTALRAEGCGIALSGDEFYNAAFPVTFISSVIIILTLVHPFATSWPSSPKGDARTLRDLFSVSYGMISITVISHLRWLSPFGALRHHLPPAERWDNKAPQSNPFISRTTISTGYSSPACGGSPAKRARGKAFPTPAGRLYGFFIRGRLP